VAQPGGAAAAAGIGVGRSADAQRLIARAVADSTRSTYAAPLRRYGEWCAERGLDAAPEHISADGAASWLASLVVGGELSAGSVKVHRSALSTAWEESLATGSNPLQSRQVQRVIAGGARELLAADAAARAARGVTAELTPRLLVQLGEKVNIQSRTLGEDRPELAMLWAAACLGVFGLLRPSEFLGTNTSRARALPAASLSFFDSPGSDAPLALLPRHLRVGDFNLPDRVAVALGVTKADQLARNGRLVIAAPMAVRALWVWCHARRDAGHAPQAPLFVWRNGRPLSCSRLLSQLTVWLQPELGPNARLTGRCFRRGGASAMLAGGADIPAIMQAGRWRSSAMVGVYSAASAKLERAVAESRAMDPLAAAAAAATPGAGIPPRR
jgi:hypothetical protein